MIQVNSEIKKEDDPKPKPISKLFKAMLTVALILYSMDFGLIKYKSLKQKIAIKLASLTVITLYTVILLIKLLLMYEMGNFMWYTRYIIEINTHVLVLMVTPEAKTFCSFLNHLHSIDAKIGVDSDSFRLDVKILIYCVASITYKMVATIIYCTDFEDCMRPIWIQILIFVLYSSLEIPLIILFFIFYATRCRLIVLRKFIEKRGCEPVHFQYLYKSLIDSTETVKKTFDPIFYVTLFIDVPCIMGIIYLIIKDITVGSTGLSGFTSESAVVLSSLIIIFAPAVAAGILSNEANQIKVCLHNMLLEENDPQKEQDIQRFINYIDARPFKFNVLGVVPMDASLPMSVLNLYITYVIVLLQLTHLY